jgi:hypothetical protein
VEAITVKTAADAAPLVKGAVQEIRDAIADCALKQASIAFVAAKEIHISLVRDPEEEWWELAFDIVVDAGVDRALAYWESLEKQLEQWARTQSAHVQETLAHRIAIAVEWSADDTAL